jgi:hypothetical protein
VRIDRGEGGEGRGGRGAARYRVASEAGVEGTGGQVEGPGEGVARVLQRHRRLGDVLPETHSSEYG